VLTRFLLTKGLVKTDIVSFYKRFRCLKIQKRSSIVEAARVEGRHDQPSCSNDWRDFCRRRRTSTIIKIIEIMRTRAAAIIPIKAPNESPPKEIGEAGGSIFEG